MNPGSETLAITLRRESPSQPWGFRLQGGTDFTTPLSVQSVNNGSVSEVCGLLPGDAILSLNNRSSDELEHEEAKGMIMMSGNEVNLVIQRGAVKVWKPKITPVSELRPSEVSHIDSQSADSGMPFVTKTSLAAEKQDVMHIGSTHNRTARPFAGFGGPSPVSQPPPPQQQQQQPYQQQQGGYQHDQQQQAYQQQQQQQPQQYGGQPGYGGGGGQAPPVVNAQYNTPIDMYSQQNVADTYDHQSQALTGNIASQNPYGQQAGGGARVGGTRSVQAPTTKAPSERKEAQYMKCKVCGSLCVGVFVKIKGEPMHPECFKCARCNMSLKQQGYITVEEKLYCENCAKQVAAPPGGNMQATAVYR